METERYDPVPACFCGVQFLPIPRLERIVLDKLRKLELHTNEKVVFPIPIEDMIEEIEKIPVEAFEGTSRFPSDVLGAYDFKSKVMFVREDIPHLGRRRFTQAHEYGHFVLHSGHFLQQVFDFYSEENDDTVQLYRGESSTRSKLEWQANMFASHFLMPTHLVKSLLQPLNQGASQREKQQILATEAQVSLQAASIRLAELG